MELQYRGVRYIQLTETPDPIRGVPDSAIGLRYRGVPYLMSRFRNQNDDASRQMQTIGK